MHFRRIRWLLLGYIWIFVLSLGFVLHGQKDDGLGMNYGLKVPNFKDSGAMRIFSPLNRSITCQDLNGLGSFNATCLLYSDLYVRSDLYIHGKGNIEILPKATMGCVVEGCTITFNVSGNVKVGQHAVVLAGSIVLVAANMIVDNYAFISTTSLGGPSQTSGTPGGLDGAGGGHGGRGASCVKSNWGGDVYAWSTLSEPWSYGSKGGGISTDKQFGGGGGGRIKLLIKDMLYLNGSVLAEGGDAGLNGGGGSGGSIHIHAVKL